MCKALLKEKAAEYGTRYGMSVYTDSELLALLTGTDPADYPQTIREVLENPFNFPGVGEKTALKIQAVAELAKRLSRQFKEKITIIRGPEDAAKIAQRRLRFEMREHFGIILLNTKNHVIGVQDISIGSLTASVVHPREVFKAACCASAASMILFHNHPSGDPSPSREDIATTERLVKAGKIFDIPILDHIIVGDTRWSSFKEKGLI